MQEEFSSALRSVFLGQIRIVTVVLVWKVARLLAEAMLLMLAAKKGTSNCEEVGNKWLKGCLFPLQNMFS